MRETFCLLVFAGNFRATNVDTVCRSLRVPLWEVPHQYILEKYQVVLILHCMTWNKRIASNSLRSYRKRPFDHEIAIRAMFVSYDRNTSGTTVDCIFTNDSRRNSEKKLLSGGLGRSEMRQCCFYLVEEQRAQMVTFSSLNVSYFTLWRSWDLGRENVQFGKVLNTLLERI